MYEVSDRFKAALRQSRTIVARAELYRQGRLIGEDIPIVSGSVTDDATALVRRRCDLTLQLDQAGVNQFLPAEPPEDGGLWPLGNELKLFTGIDFEDGTDPEYIPAGVYRISRPKLSYSGQGVGVSVQGNDRSRTVQRAKFTSPYTIRSGQNYATEIKKLLQSRMPWMTDEQFKFMATDFTTPVLTFLWEDDPWEMAVKMAASIGAELFLDFDGEFVLRPEPDLAVGTSVFDYVEGEDATFTSITRDLDEEDTFNGIMVSGESTSNKAAVQAIVWDTDPESPTYYDPNNPSASVFGPHPDSITSEFVTNFTQAVTMAQAELRRRLGVVENIQFDSVVNPAHESNDIIHVASPAIAVNNLHVLQSLQYDIGPIGKMSGTTRKRRVAA